SPAATSNQIQVLRAFMRKAALTPSPQPYQTSQREHAPGQGRQQEPLRSLQLTPAHHQPILVHRLRAQALEELRAGQQPIHSEPGKLPITRRLDRSVRQKK